MADQSVREILCRCAMIAHQLSSLFALAIVGPTLASLVISVAGCNRVEAQPPSPAKPPEVFYTTPAQETVTEFEEFTGRTDTIKKVEIRARVSGYLDKVLFADGADVKEGQLLFQIDPRWFRADAERAAAVATQAKAHFDRLDREVARDRPLV